MITDQRPRQSTPEPVMQGPELDPHPKCAEHPRKELEFFCKAHCEVICASCVITQHFECQHSRQLEGVESAARKLREEVTADRAQRAAERKEELVRAAKMVVTRQLDVLDQCEALVEKVDGYFRSIVEAAEARRQELRNTLIAEKERKDAVLISQIMQLRSMAEMLEERMTGALEAITSADIQNEPVVVIMEGLRLRQELEEGTRASEASDPLEEANLHVSLPPMEPTLRDIREAGWAGALSVDHSQCVLTNVSRPLAAGSMLNIGLDVRNHRGERVVVEEGLVVAAAAAGARANVRKQEDGALVVDVQACVLTAEERQREVEVEVKIGGKHIASSPFQITVIADTDLCSSSILTTAEYVKSVLAFVPRKAFKLLYRATRDGWSASDFHTRCDGRGATVVLVRSTSSGESIFGGYTSTSWTSSSDYHADSSSFLFSVLNVNRLPPSKLVVKGGQVGNAVYHHKEYGPTFGGGFDLHLSDMANSNSRSHSNLGFAYEAPAGVQANTFLAGARVFMSCEIEVYLLQ